MLDGIYNQKGDHPKCSVDDYLRYVVDLPNEQHEIAFFKKSQKRPLVDGRHANADPSTPNQGGLLVPCTHDEYIEASEGSLPDRWWRTFQKLA